MISLIMRERDEGKADGAYEHARELAWAAWSPVLEDVLTAQVRDLPCALTPEDVSLLEASYDARAPLRNDLLSRDAYVYLAKRFAGLRPLAGSAELHAGFTLHVFAEPLVLDGVPLTGAYDVRARTNHFAMVLKEQSARDFKRFDDYEELFWRVWSERIRHEIIMDGHEVSADPRFLAEVASAVAARAPIPCSRPFEDGFAAVFQATLFRACERFGEDPWAYADALRERVFVPGGTER